MDGVGKTPERVFEWKLPVVEPAPARTLASTLMLVLGVIGALMVILSPCAIELTTYYTGIIAGVVSSAALAERGSRIPAAVRGRILRNLAAFVAGFTVLYMASGATVALLGQQLLGLQTQLNNGAQLEEALCDTTPARFGWNRRPACCRRQAPGRAGSPVHPEASPGTRIIMPACLAHGRATRTGWARHFSFTSP